MTNILVYCNTTNDIDYQQNQESANKRKSSTAERMSTLNLTIQQKGSCKNLLDCSVPCGCRDLTKTPGLYAVQNSAKFAICEYDHSWSKVMPYRRWLKYTFISYQLSTSGKGQGYAQAHTRMHTAKIIEHVIRLATFVRNFSASFQSRTFVESPDKASRAWSHKLQG